MLGLSNDISFLYVPQVVWAVQLIFLFYVIPRSKTFAQDCNWNPRNQGWISFFPNFCLGFCQWFFRIQCIQFFCCFRRGSCFCDSGQCVAFGSNAMLTMMSWWSSGVSGEVGRSWRYCNARPTRDEAGASSWTSSPCKNQFNIEGGTWPPYQILSW